MLRIFPLWLIWVIWTLQSKRNNVVTVQQMRTALAMMEEALNLVPLHKLNRLELWLVTRANLWLAKEAIDLKTLENMGVVSSIVSEK